MQNQNHSYHKKKKKFYFAKQLKITKQSRR